MLHTGYWNNSGINSQNLVFKNKLFLKVFNNVFNEILAQLTKNVQKQVNKKVYLKNAYNF